MRMDWVQEVVESKTFSDGSASFSVILKPDPKRYEEIMKNNKVWGYRDKFTNSDNSFKGIKRSSEGNGRNPNLFLSHQKKMIIVNIFKRLEIN